MRHKSHKDSSKLFLLLVLVLGVYLAWFGFDVKKAFDFTFSGVSEMLDALGGT